MAFTHFKAFQMYFLKHINVSTCRKDEKYRIETQRCTFYKCQFKCHVNNSDLVFSIMRILKTFAQELTC